MKKYVPSFRAKYRAREHAQRINIMAGFQAVGIKKVGSRYKIVRWDK